FPTAQPAAFAQPPVRGSPLPLRAWSLRFPSPPPPAACCRPTSCQTACAPALDVHPTADRGFPAPWPDHEQNSLGQSPCRSRNPHSFWCAVSSALPALIPPPSHVALPARRAREPGTGSLSVR